jgi:serine/threonine protein kinase
VDKRADIWAFGVVLYEMLAGKRLFRGEDITEILASVVKEKPDLSGVPAKVRPLLESCLEKDPKKGSGAKSVQGRGWLGFSGLSVRDGLKRRAPHSSARRRIATLRERTKSLRGSICK